MSQIIPFGIAAPNFKEAECPICLDTFSVDTRVQVLFCMHIFHSECVAEMQRRTCPLCDKIISPIVDSSTGFYCYLYRFLINRLPHETGAWDQELLQIFSMELQYAMVQLPEWNKFIPIKKFKDLIDRFDPEKKSIAADDPVLVWQEALFKEFKNHPRIQPLFEEIARRHIAQYETKLQALNLLQRIIAVQTKSLEEVRTLEKARKLCPQMNTKTLFWSQYFALPAGRVLSDSG